MFKLLAPIGLIALIGIPVVIIIYILKPKYQEKKVTSTHIWRLSLKYRKRKIPLQWLKRSLLLFVQLLIVAVIAFMLANPNMVEEIDDKESKEKLVILDASASMMTVSSNGKTRFENAKDAIKELAQKSDESNNITVILCDDTPEEIEGMNPIFDVSKDYIDDWNDCIVKMNMTLSNTQCTYKTADYSAALDIARDKREANEDLEVYLYTDREFTTQGFVNVVSFAEEQDWNASILKVEEFKGNNDYIYFQVTVGSFYKKGTYNLSVNITGVNGYGEDIERSKLTIKQVVDFNQAESEEDDTDNNQDTRIIRVEGEKESVLASGANADMRISSYNMAEFKLTTTDGEEIGDSFSIDDQFYCFGAEAEKFNVQVVSNQASDITTPPYVVAALSANPEVYISEVSARLPLNTAVTTGFDLYVYDGVAPPTILPTDGAVWIINPPNGNYSANYGFTAQGTTQQTANLATTTDALSQTLAMNMISSIGTKVTRYTDLTVTNEDMQTVMTINDQPAIIAGEKDGIKIVVFGFDLRYTDIPLTINMPILTQNIASYTLKHTLEDYSYDIDSDVVINAKPNAEYVEITYATEDVKPTYYGNKKYASAWSSYDVKMNYEYNTLPLNYSATMPGVYTISQHLDNTSEAKVNNFYVALSEEECYFGANPKLLAQDDEEETGSTVINEEEADENSLMFWFALGLLVLLLFEWGLQYREQY